VDLVGFITKKLVTMQHGHVTVKWSQSLWTWCPGFWPSVIKQFNTNILHVCDCCR